MPAPFDKCARNKGRIRTIKRGNKCTVICFKGGKSFAGETKKCR